MTLIPLACRSYYSLLRGTMPPGILMRRLKKLGYHRCAITDVNNLYGLLFIHQAAREAGVDLITGATLTDPHGRELILLVQDAEGYRRLCHLITEIKKNPEFDFTTALAQDHQGLVILTREVEWLEQLAGEGVYAALAPGDFDGYRRYRKRGFTSVALPVFAFAGPRGPQLHRILRAIALNTSLSRLPESEVWSSEWQIKAPAELEAAYAFAPETVEHTRLLADRCTWRPENHDPIFPPQDQETAYRKLEELVYAGARERYGQLTAPVKQRIAKELKLVKEKGFAGYFLIVREIVGQQTITCGRGSAAASIIAYCLKITHVDPIRHKLFFERFLSPGRKDQPDIDVDFPWDTRDQVLEWVFQHYGREHTAMIADHITFKARSAVREVAKVYGLPEGEIGTLTKRLRPLWYLSRPLEQLHTHPMLQDLELPPPWPEILRYSFALQGFPRHLSVHPGGVVITPKPVWNYVPVEQAPKGVTIIQWEKDQAEEFGLVKIDLLGNRSLAVIRDTIAAVNDHYGRDLAYWRLNPLEDPVTQNLIRSGRTMGCFYIESPATRQLLLKMETGDYENLVIASSIIRPAANKWIREFVRRLHGGYYRPLHPLLEDTLKETYGIMVYQEDVTKVAMRLAGFSADEGNELRKIMSKKHKTARLEDFRQRFYAGARQRKVKEEVIDYIWDMILSFSGYSFCKPHSASYALVSFKAAFLKAHYPAEFMAAVISNRGGYYSTFGYISEARRLGLTILPPDINESEINYTGWDKQLRVGLMQLKGVQLSTLEALIAERRRNGPYLSLDNFLKRLPEVSTADIRILIKAGCFDHLAGDTPRPQLLWQLYQTRGEKAEDEYGSPPAKIAPPAEDLFAKEVIKSSPLPELPDYDTNTKLKFEIETLGFLISRHPLELYQPLLKNLDFIYARDLKKHVGRRVRLIGWLITGKVVHTLRDEPMEFVSFEDTTAIYETVFFPEVYRRFCRMLSDVRPYLIKGKVEQDFNAVSVTVEEVEFLDKILGL